MEKIIIYPVVEEKLYQLVDVLFEEGYFGFMESAIEYKDKIVHLSALYPTLKRKKLKIINTEPGTVVTNTTVTQPTLSHSITKTAFI